MELSSRSRLAQFRGAKVLFSDGASGFESALGSDHFNIYYTKNNEAMIQFENLKNNGQSY